MIKQDEIFKIGKLLKPHGIKGEIAFTFDNDIFDRVDCPYLICPIDQIYVPFFIKEYRFKGSETALVKFEGFDSEEKVRILSNIDVFFPRKYLADNEEEEINYSWNYFLNFTVIDSSNNENIGTIIAIDELTINVLFLIEDANKNEFVIPASEDLIIDIDNENKTLTINLPEGLLDI